MGHRKSNLGNGEKIGIMTFHASHNCGSMLQSFALQSVLMKMRYKPTIIDFSNTGQRKLYDVKFKNDSIKNVIKNLIIFPHLHRIKKTALSYEKFKRTNFNLTTKKYSRLEDLNENDFDFTKYVCGSDQIWNITIADGDDAYFLPFVHNYPKIAYAPSFGAKNLLDYAGNRLGWYRDRIMEFGSLSVREKNGQKWIEQIIGQKPPVVLDPTLLLEPEEYDVLEKKVDIPEHFIFYYAPGYLKNLNKFVRKISKRYGMPVIVFNAKQFYIKRLWRYGFRLLENEDPGAYLYLMKKADIVFTTSFHGTIFASMFHRNFWTLKNTGMFGEDDRVRTLVAQLGIEDRLIVPSQMPDDFDYLLQFDYERYQLNLNSCKNYSLNFLEEALTLS